MNTLRLAVLSVTVGLMGCAGTAGDTAAEGDLLTGADVAHSLMSCACRGFSPLDDTPETGR